jgi:hypothetical protein
LQIADLKPGEDVPPHEPDACPCFTWRTLEKQYLWLLDQLDAAVGRRPELAELLAWPGCFLVEEREKGSRRGRPSLKRPFYLLAAEFVALARFDGGEAPRGFYTALARHLSFPWYGISFTPGELREAVRGWYAKSPGLSPEGRVFLP